jgi:CubicO group peptidase (beta-lactamase class C family)
MKRNLILTLAIGLLGHMVFAQDLDKAKLDSYFDALETNNRFMGSVAVAKDGKVIYTKTIGLADIENNIEANPDTKYRIGSISKTFTAVLVFKAMDQELVSLDQTIHEYFPSIENADKITIKQLLNHRSGIHNITNDAEYFTWNTQKKSEQEMVDIISKAGSDFEPGSKAEYSNSNYVLLTYILERSFKKPYADLLTQYITKPLGLKNTYLGGKIDTENNECKSYRFMGNWNMVTETDISVPMGAGGVVSTPTDLVRFSDALFGGKLIKDEYLTQMKNIVDNFGIGLFQFPFHSRIGFGHTGGIDGFSSVFTHFADGNVSYAMVSNGSNYTNNDISIAVLSAVFGMPFDVPQFKAYEVTAEDLDQYLGVYSSPQFPLKITITKDNNTLIAQATGQPSFPLEASGKDKFEFIPAGLVLEFNPAESSMILKQRGAQFTLTKE